jgi:hypothetical protein
MTTINQMDAKFLSDLANRVDAAYAQFRDETDKPARDELLLVLAGTGVALADAVRMHVPEAAA